MMEKLFNLIGGKIGKITETDKIMAMDYMAYFGYDENEIAEYADEFLADCYHLINEDADYYDDDYGMYEPNDPDHIPMATVKKSESGLTYYTYNGKTIIK